MKAESFIGWDVGGAHLKMAHVDVTGKIIAAHQFPTPVWQGLEVLHDALTSATQYFPEVNARHVVTTTAELSDIFKDRRSGVDKLANRMSSSLNIHNLLFYAGHAGWIEAGRTDEYVNEIASANWHATASFIAERINTGVLVDIGSTTTDIIPFAAGKLLNQGYTDYERLSSHELVYTGIVRTPVMAVTDHVPIKGLLRPVVAEHFATMADVYRLTGELQEQDDMMTTADGAGKSVPDSTRRLARMFAVDLDEHEDTDMWINVAHSIADIQFEKIRLAFEQVLLNMPAKNNPVVIGAGAGRFLANKLAQISGYAYMDFAGLLDASPEIKPCAARSAAAVAVAQLARSAA
jgi:(4-(4-[2-(gamma-L-glutamylamino)ethyl]phenoxymethyl)furan-2-yl)methanamine synthase